MLGLGGTYNLPFPFTTKGFYFIFRGFASGKQGPRRGSSIVQVHAISLEQNL